ncbi:MAG: preprotein translocase subunit YajC [Methylophilales bacterium]|nr:preprotein translocase subunit YajC [Methylophilales bacterium]
MTKFLLFALIAWLIIKLLKRQQRPNPPPAEKTDDMVACAVCAVHIPKSEAISSQTLFYCSEAHFLARNKQGESALGKFTP